MTYITIYNPNINPGRARPVDLVHPYRTEDHETELLFDLRWYFRQQYLDENDYEQHLLAAVEHTVDELAVDFALLLLTTLEPGWDTDHRAEDYGCEGEYSALLAHAIEHPYDWNTVGGGMVRDIRRNSLVHVSLQERGGRLAIVALDTNRGLSGEYVPLSHVARHLSPRGLYSTLFSMLPAIAEHMAVYPDEGVWGDEVTYAAIVDIPPTSYDAEAPHLKTLQGWKSRAEDAVTEAIACAKQKTGANLNERS